MAVTNPSSDLALAGATVLVIGGGGALGTPSVAALRAQGADVRTLSRRAAAPGDTHQGTVLDRVALADAMAGVDVVVHLAGAVDIDGERPIAELRELHVTGGVWVVEAAARAGVRRVVLGSSAGVVEGDGGVDAPYAFAATRASGYLRTKLEAEVAILDRADALGVSLVALRPTLVLSPRAWARTLRRLAACCDGETDVVDARDVAAVIAAACIAEEPDRAYAVGGHATSFEALRETLSIKRVTHGLGLATARAFAAPFGRVDASAARAHLGLTPHPLHTSLAWAMDGTR